MHKSFGLFFQVKRSVSAWAVSNAQMATSSNLVPTMCTTRRSSSDTTIDSDIREFPPRKKTSMNVLEIFGKTATVHQTVPIEDTIVKAVDEEMLKYINMSILDSIDEFDVVAWWAKLSDKLVHLSSYANFIHSIPATSAPSERNFSALGKTITDKRSRLDAETVDALLFMKSNFDIVSKFNLFDPNDINTV